MANPFDQFDAKPEASEAKASGKNPFDQFDGPELTPAGVELKDRAKAAFGGIEAAASMASGLPKMLWGGINGLGAYLAYDGDIEHGMAGKAAAEADIPSYEPQTKYGKLALEAVGEAGSWLKDKASDIGGYIGRDVGRGVANIMNPSGAPIDYTNAERIGDRLGRFGGEGLGGSAAALSPIPGGKFVRSVERGLKREFGIGSAEGANAGPAPTKKSAGQAGGNPFDVFDNEKFLNDQYGKAFEADKKQVDMLEAALRRRGTTHNEDQPITVDSNGQAVRPDQAPYSDLAGRQAEQGRYSTAQDAIDARQRALEEQMARQAGLDNNAAERARQAAAPVPGMEDARAREAEQAAQRTQPYMDERNQGLIDDSDHGYVANQFGGGQQGLRIDENGMPIRADRSMEAQNLTDPLQRNMWGDEMPRQSAQEAQRGITAAMDRMAPEDRAAAIKSQFPNSQRGAIDVEAFTSGRKFKYVGDGTRLYFFQHPTEGPSIRAEREGKTIGEMKLKTDTFDARPDSNIEASWTYVDPSMRKKGIAEKMYKFAAEMGDVQASTTLLPDGRAMWEGFDRKGLSTDWKIPKGQRGAIDLGPGKTPDNPAVANIKQDDPRVVLAAKQLEDQAKKATAFKVLDMPYVDTITTPEQVLAAAPKAKDIGAGAAIRAKSVGAGMNSAALSSNNPLLKYVRNATREAEKWADSMSAKYITGDNGLAGKWQKLNAPERNEVMKHLLEQDKTQTIMDTSHMTDKQRAVVEHIAEMERVKLQVWNEKLTEAGMKPVEERVGHFPGMFTGDYRTMIFDAKGHPQGFVGTATRWGHNKVLEKLKEKYPDHKFVPLARKSLAGMGERAYTTGMSELAKALAEHDPKFKELMDEVNTLVAHNADNLYGAGLHRLGKKGIFGSEGNKDWKSATENTNEAMAAYKRYWDEGMRSHATLPVEVNVKGLMQNPALDHMPNAKGYVEKYLLNMTGRSSSHLAHALDSLLDLGPRIAGIGPSLVRDTFGVANKRVGQLLMGFGNLPHTLTQLLQVPSMGVPQVMNIAQLVGKNTGHANAALMAGMRDMGTSMRERFSGETTAKDPYSEAMFEYAKKNGMDHFSEFQDIAESNQGRAGRVYDKVVDFNRSESERATRPVVYYSIARLMEDVPGLTTEQKLSAAINATNEAMIDYSPREKPMAYRSLGQMGKLAGSLTTFKHGAAAQYGRLVKQAANGNAKPLVAMTAIMYALAGVRGIFSYDDADTVVKAVTGALGERQSIREILLDPNIQSEYFKAGALSASTGLDVAGRLNVGGFIPESPLQAALGASGSKVLKIGEAAYQASKNLVGKGNGPIDFKNLALELAPGGHAKTLLREGLMNNEKTNILQDKNAEPGNRRTPEDVRATKLGFTSLRQGLLNEAQYNDQRRHQANQEKQKAILDQAQHYKAQDLLVVNGQLTPKGKELRDAYFKAGGTTDGWVNNIMKEAFEMNKTKQQRLQGDFGDSEQSQKRYKDFERSRKYNNAN